MEDTTLQNEDLNTNGESGNQNGNSADTKVWDEKYPKWQKMLPKEYWGDEKLAKYSSLKDVIDDATTPKTKAPDSYSLEGIDDALKKSLGEAYKKADISDADAKEITGLWVKAMPKMPTEENLKDVVGLADYEVEKAYFDKAVSKICGANDKLKDAMSKSAYRNDPTVFQMLSIVGKNLGDGNFEDFRSDKAGKKNDVWADMVARPKDYKGN